MPPAGVQKGSKRARQYEHIKDSLEEQGNPRAEEIAARTVNKQRAAAGETRSERGARHMQAEGRTRAELYREAKQLGIEGRSKMRKSQLASAIARKRR